MGIATAALVTAGALAVSWLGGYVAFDEHSAGDGAQPPVAGTVVVDTPEPRREPQPAAGGDTERGEPTTTATEGSTRAVDGRGHTATATAGPGTPDPAAPGAGADGGETGPGVNEPPADAGDPPVAVPPQPVPPPGDAPPEPKPVDPVPVVPPPVSTDVPAPGPVTAITTGLDDTLAATGLDLPVTELTDPVTEPVDELLGALTGHH